jgi:hypothetical protein
MPTTREALLGCHTREETAPAFLMASTLFSLAEGPAR